MKTTLGINYYCRQAKVDKKGKAPIEVGITVNGKRVFLSTPRKETPAVFKKEMMKKNSELKEYCRGLENNINTAITDLVKTGTAVTAYSIKEYIRNGGVKTYTVGELFDDFLKYYKKRVDVDITYGAYRKYEILRDLFFKHSGMLETDELTALNNMIVLNFFAELKKKYVNASYCSYMAKLKSVVKFGMDSGKLVLNPFLGVKIHRDKPNIEVLTESELEAIKSVKLGSSLDRVRDCFLFQAYSGLSYIDMANLKPEDIQINNGVYFIKKNRIKTNTEFVSVLLSGGYEILLKYGFNLPCVSNQKTNEFLKQICRLANLSNYDNKSMQINKNLHTHLARHTYAFLLLNKYGVRAETVARALGHTSPKTTLKYYANISVQTTVDEIGESIKRVD